jgi:hypothetical protein
VQRRCIYYGGAGAEVQRRRVTGAELQVQRCWVQVQMWCICRGAEVQRCRCDALCICRGAGAAGPDVGANARSAGASADIMDEVLRC